jgi:hypothetical protein
MVLSVVNEKDKSIEGKIDEKVLKRSTTVENSLQIDPFYAKQSQFQIRQNKRKHFLSKYLGLIGQLVIQKKQTQFKPNKAKNKPNLSQFKANTNPIQTQFSTPKGANFTNEADI